MSTQRWRTLRAGRPDELVLAVDYWQGRTGTGFRELAAGLGGSSTVLESVPPPEGDRLGDAARHLAWWSTGVDAGAVRLVLGNCAGAGFAVALAGLLAERGDRDAPPVLLFDPQLVDAEVVTVEFGRMTAGLGAAPGSGPAPTGPLASYVDDLAARYHLMLTDFATVDDALDDEYVEELTSHGRRYLGYLAAAAELDLSGAAPAEVAYLSDEPCSGAGLAVRAVRFDVDRAGLLGEHGVASAVNDMMGVAG
jgi:hypothetical protein